MISKAKFVKEVSVIDPDSQGQVEVAIYKHENGGMFGIDSSYVDQMLEEGHEIIPDPLNDGFNLVRLLED